jgi:hypothetical protein
MMSFICPNFTIKYKSWNKNMHKNFLNLIGPYIFILEYPISNHAYILRVSLPISVSAKSKNKVS